MAVNEEKELKFIWKLENYSYCWNKTDDFLQSPIFQMNVFYGTSWFLKLYPRGVSSYENYISVYLGRLASCKGPLGITVDYEIAFIRNDGASEYAKKKKDRCIRRGHAFGFDNLAVRDEILGAKKLALLPEDILTVQCTIFPKGVQLKSHTEIIAKTHIQLERVVFLQEIQPINGSLKGFIHGVSLERLRGIKTMIIKLNGIPFEVPEFLEFTFYNEGITKKFFCKIGIIDSNNSVSQYLIDKHFDLNLCEAGSVKEIASSLSIDEILKRKSLYLPNDKLTLHYDLTISFGVKHEQIEVIHCDNTFIFPPAKVKASPKTDLPLKNCICSCTDNYSSLKNDFQNLYREETVCDFIIKVGGEILRVHKAVLCARSSVFKAMLTSNMKETEKNQVDISDLEIDTVRRMLAFMYTDTTGDLDWDTAKRLYFAADKYVLLNLKRICSEVLKQNLSVANVGEIITLASMHADEDLKKTALEFVDDHETQVMCSMEWKTFMTEELHLAAEIMHQILLKKAGNHR